MDASLIVILMVVGLLVLILVGVPIGFSLGTISVVGLILLRGYGIAMKVLMVQPYAILALYALTVVPVYVLMGQLAYAAGVSADAYSVGRKWLGGLPGGLGMATMAGATVFAAACGSSIASAASIGRIAIPEMERSGYEGALAGAIVATGGLLAILIPPSVPLVLYGLITEQSIGTLFLAGFIPGTITSLIFILGIFIMAKRSPHLMPTAKVKESWKARFLSLKQLWAALLLVVIVIGGLYLGVYTATEAGSVGALVALILVLRKVGSGGWTNIRAAFWDTVRTSTMVFTIFLGAMLFATFTAMSGVTQAVTGFLVGLDVPNIVVLLAILVLYVPLGMFLDPGSMILMTMPIVFPAIIALGYNGIWFGILLVKLCEIGLLTPPVGLNVFVVKGIAPHIPLGMLFRRTGSFLLMEFIALAILIAFPKISLWLPTMAR